MLRRLLLTLTLFALGCMPFGCTAGAGDVTGMRLTISWGAELDVTHVEGFVLDESGVELGSFTRPDPPGPIESGETLTIYLPADRTIFRE